METKDAASLLGAWYRILAVQKQARTGFTAQQLTDLRAIVPTGMPPLLQYLVVKLTNPATRLALGISDEVANSVRGFM